MFRILNIVICCFAVVLGTSQVVGQSNVENEKKEANKVIYNSSSVNTTTNTLQSVELNVIANPSNSANFSPSLMETESTKLSQEILAEPAKAENWGNYYRAQRYSYYSKTSNDITSEEQKDLNQIIDNMAKYVPASYEFHYLKYINGNKNPDLIKHLEKAYELNPKSSEVMVEFASYYELTNNEAKKKEFCKALSDAGIYSEGVLEYNYNLLNSLDQNAILITHGENDTYPAWIQQNVKSVRADVKILYIELLENKEYRETVFKELGLEITTDITKDKSGFLKEIASDSKKRPVYFANTVAPELLKPMSANLYLTGLAFKYSDVAFDNIASLKKNWNDKMKKEELKSEEDKTGTMESKLNLNYLPGILLLYENYSKDGNKEAVKLKELALKLGSEGGKEHQVRLYLEK